VDASRVGTGVPVLPPHDGGQPVPTTDEDRAQEALGQEECLRLLGSSGIGRLAYTQAALPAIRPVSFILRNADVLIPVRSGSLLADAVRGAVVAFETDVYDDVTRTGWTVTVVGPSRVVAAEGRHAGRRLIAVRVGLVQGWRTTLPRCVGAPGRT
jgi:hypothetical protein